MNNFTFFVCIHKFVRKNAPWLFLSFDKNPRQRKLPGDAVYSGTTVYQMSPFSWVSETTL